MAKPVSMAERVKQKAKEAEFSGGNDTLRVKDGISFFKPKKGKNEIMIVPFEMGAGKNLEDIQPGELWFRQQLLKHFRVGPDDKAVICPRTIGKKCPICEHRASLLAQGRSTDDAEVKELLPKKRELYYIIDLEDDDRLKIFEYSYHNFGKKLEEEVREADDDSLAVNFADPDDGAIVVVRMAEASMGKNKFLEASRFDFEERGKEEKKIIQQAIGEVTPFGELMIIHSYEELRNLFYDLDPDETEAKQDQDEEEEAPRSRSSRRRSEPEPDADEEEEAPKRRRGRASQEETENPDEEEEAPRSRSSRRRSEPESAPFDTEEEEAPRSRSSRGAKEETKAPRSRRADPDPDEEESESKPGKPVKHKCQFDGVFGETCDTLEACEDCAIWADCRAATDEYEAGKKRKR